MLGSFYESFVNYIWSTQETAASDTALVQSSPPLPLQVEPPLQVEDDQDCRPPSRIRRFVDFTLKQYPDLSPEQLDYLRTKFYKVNRQLVINPRFRHRRFDWSYLAAKLTDHTTENLDLEDGDSLVRNNSLWNELSLKLD